MSATPRAIRQDIRRYIAQPVKCYCEAKSVTLLSVSATILDEFDVIAKQNRTIRSYIFLFEGFALQTSIVAVVQSEDGCERFLWNADLTNGLHSLLALGLLLQQLLFASYITTWRTIKHSLHT
jgi:hypothetical protein